jgi:hypothetical protein
MWPWGAPVDHVFTEIEMALKAKITILPLLIGGAVMPRLTALPRELADFCYLNAREFDTDPQSLDLQLLVASLRSLVGK